MYLYRKTEQNPFALSSRAANTYNSSQIFTFRGANDNRANAADTATITEYSGPAQEIRARLMISVPNGGTAQLLLQSLTPGQDGTQAYHWLNIGDTLVQSAAGSYVILAERMVPTIVRLQLIIAIASVTAGAWLEIGG